MKTYSSAICSAVLVIGGLCWYKYCLRIYNRFKFTEPDIDWKESPLENEETNKRKKSYQSERYSIGNEDTATDNFKIKFRH